MGEKRRLAVCKKRGMERKLQVGCMLELRPLSELFFSAPEKLALPTSLDQQSKLARICQGIEKKGV